MTKTAHPLAEPCPRCGSAAGLVWVHGHGQCIACGSNVHDCCQGAPCGVAPGASGSADGATPAVGRADRQAVRARH